MPELKTPKKRHQPFCYFPYQTVRTTANGTGSDTYSFSRTLSDTVLLLQRTVQTRRFIFGYECTSYLGSHGTYPLDIPVRSLTTTSKLSKSQNVQASKATSNKTRDHSKKA